MTPRLRKQHLGDVRQELRLVKWKITSEGYVFENGTSDSRNSKGIQGLMSRYIAMFWLALCY
jgi:hypothetical protein